MDIADRSTRKNSWNDVRLKDIGPLVDGDWILTADYKDSGVRLLQVGDIGSGKYRDRSSRFISKERAIDLGCTFLHPRDILISRMPDPIGRACMCPDLGYECITAVDVSIWRPNASIANGDYLIHVLSSQDWYKRVLAEASGATRPRISRLKLENLKITLPPLAEQERLAGILNERMAAIEKARAASEAQLASAGLYQISYLQHIFGSESDLFKSGVQLRKLGDICEVRGGKRLPKGHEFAKEITKHPYLRVVDFFRGTIRQNNLRYISEETFAEISRYIIRVKDIYVSIAGTVGLAGIVPEHLDGSNLTENAARLVIKDPMALDDRYIATYLRSPHGQKQIDARTNKVGQPKLALERLSAIMLPVPELKEQKRIMNKTNEAEVANNRLRESIKKQTTELSTLAAALLRQAFNGEL